MSPDIRWKQVVLSFLVGSIVTAGVLHCKRSWWRHDGKDRYQHMLDKFSRELKLTDEQKPKVAAIFEEKRRKIEAIRSEVHPRYDAIHRSASDEIRRLLTPEQQAKFDEMEKKQAEKRRRWMERKGHGRMESPSPAR
jgi:Spy/CpxP family protein refolding chaperone